MAFKIAREKLNVLVECKRQGGYKPLQNLVYPLVKNMCSDVFGNIYGSWIRQGRFELILKIRFTQA